MRNEAKPKRIDPRETLPYQRAGATLNAWTKNTLRRRTCAIGLTLFSCQPLIDTIHHDDVDFCMIALPVSCRCPFFCQ
jgi:hypothetical protein